jgi:hypothetical protein
MQTKSILVFLILSFCCFGQNNINQIPVKRSNIINSLEKSLLINDIKHKYGIPFETYNRGTNQIVLLYFYWPQETQPINKLGWIPNGIELIFENEKLIDWKENYFRHEK